MKRSFTVEQDEVISQQHLGGMSVHQIAALYGTCRQAVCNALARTGTAVRQVQEALTPEQKVEAARLYQEGQGSVAIGKIMKVSQTTILKALNQADVEMRDESASQRKHSIDVHVFDRVTQGSAYWIGFLMADGSVSKAGQVALWVSEKDRAHVEKFRDFLRSSHPIRTVKRTRMAHCPKKGKIYTAAPVVGVGIWCKPIAEALRRYGLHENKSYGATIIGLEDKPDFWRGVIDGDGSLIPMRPRGSRILKSKKVRPCAIRLYGSRTLLGQFARFARKTAPGCKALVLYDQPNTVCVVNGGYAVKILEVLYGTCGEALERKRAMAWEIIAIWKQRQKTVAEMTSTWARENGKKGAKARWG